MTTANPRRRTIVVLGFLAATVIPLAAFVLANRRVLAVAILFVRWESRGWHAFWIVASVALMLCSALVFRYGQSILRLVHIPWYVLVSTYKATPALAVLLVVGLSSVGIMGVRYVGLRYKIFSETAYQEIAIESVQSGDLARARFVCERYLRLYPQRSSSGSIPDPVCVELLDFMDSAAILKARVSAADPVVGESGGITLPVLWGTRRQALEVLERWAGGRRVPGYETSRIGE